MKVKALVVDPSLLLGIAQSIDKLGKLCIFRLDPESIQFTVAENLNGGQVWTQIPSEVVFEDYHVSSNNDNVIALELVVDHLLRTLKSAKPGSEVSMRLIKKNDHPFLSFNMQTQTSNGKSFSILQEIPARVLSPDEIDRIREPPLKVSDVDVQILFPSLQTLRNIVERLKALSGYMTIAANMRGELELRVHTESAEVTTHFKDLVNPEINITEENQEKPASSLRDPLAMAEARVDIKDFQRFLQSHHVYPQNVVCCILEDTAVILYVYVGSPKGNSNVSRGALTYYIPAVMR